MKISTLYHAEGKVWKLLIDDSQDVLLIEARDEEEREVTFSAIDLHQQKALWVDYLLEEPWWLTMQYAQNGILLITEFEDDQNPVSKNIIAIDVHKGTGLWQLDGVFETANGTSALLKINESDRILVNLHEGITKPFVPTNASLFTADPITLVILPHHYPQDLDYYTTVASFLTDRLQVTPSLAIDYMETDHCIIIAYYEQKGIHYHHKLVVFSKDGSLITSSDLGEALTGIGNEPFLVYKEYLLFVKDKHLVQCINLYHLPQ